MKALKISGKNKINISYNNGYVLFRDVRHSFYLFNIKYDGLGFYSAIDDIHFETNEVGELIITGVDDYDST